MKSAIRYSFIIWLIFYLVVSTLISPTGDIEVVLIRVALLVVPQMIIFYINMVVLLPNYFEEQKYITFIILLAFVSCSLAFSFGYLDIYMDKTFPLSLHHFSPRGYGICLIGRLMSFVPPIVIGALIRKSILLQRKTEESMELQNKMLAAETNALKAQINPHFLFNTLNNIYSLSQFDNDKTGEAILQLSDILRYVTYEGDKKTVPIAAEIEHIKSFLKLQLLRDEDDSNIYVDIGITEKNLQISPLLMIPFIENSFKHGNHHDKVNGWIKIKIKDEDSKLTLIVSNSLNSEANSTKDKVGGVGMENVRKRLSLLYPGEHDLVLKMDKKSYSSILKINLKK
ncbi:MAG: histidine kinase [Crocinitomix sp.]|nr:histidine kinase [Crocinitomix sp.]